VAGLVAITPASGFVGPLPALLIGLLAGVVCFAAVELKGRLSIDDSLDVVGVHLVGGIVGALLTGVFASLLVNPTGADGSLAQVGRQAVAVGVTLVFSFVATMAILRLVDRIVGLRVDETAEEEGLDRSQHGERAYVFGDGVKASRTLPFDPDAELARLREQLVAETTRRAVQALKAPDPLD
jgi:Amt family ammonium transporter